MAHDHHDDDKRILHSMGYAQELLRGMKTFQNFAISFSIICILSGGINSFSQGLGSVGGAAIGIGWPVALVFSFLVALSMAQIASAFPTAGGLYHWGSILGGRAVGWVTAWFNLVGLITVLAAINVGTYLFFVGALAPYLGIDATALTPTEPTLFSIAVQTVCVALITVSQGLVNHLGIRLTSRLTDFSGYVILLGSLALTVSLLAFAPHIDFARLVTFTNYSGDAGGGVWPQTGNMGYLFLLGLLLPAYTITGFDASAHTAEETIDAARTVPKGMTHSVLWSGVFGWVMLGAIVLAAPDLGEAAGNGAGQFFFIMDHVLPGPLKILLYVVIFLGQYLCGLATVTSASRMVFAFARDGGLPFSSSLRKIHPIYRTPVFALWMVVILAILFTVYTPVYTTIAAVCTMFLYISYLLPVAAGLIAYRRRWTQMGPFDLGALFPLVAVASLAGGCVLIYIGIQPPNDQALTVTLGALAITAVVWFGLERRRFQGPPMGTLSAEKLAEITAREQAVGEPVVQSAS
ncbi:MAG: amino acid permease [Azospirillaceae bacterium]|nr:amino acid permease [Azospirillaceae bacterium]